MGLSGDDAGLMKAAEADDEISERRAVDRGVVAGDALALAAGDFLADGDTTQPSVRRLLAGEVATLVEWRSGDKGCCC